jgi:cytochrome c oxidase cbb3-type subunit I/II
MPAYPWLYTSQLGTSLTKKKPSVLKTLGTPYTDEQVANAERDLAAQATQVASELRSQQAPLTDAEAKSEIIALIAYLQRLGMDLKRAEGAK